ncbi:MAG: hypothetical protein ACLGHN_15055 [Bacteriovoracia bacterium]
MRVLFLLAVFISFIFTVEAQRTFSQYICQLSHKHSQKTFYLGLGESKKVKVGGWNIFAGLSKKENEITVSLRRVVSIMDATYQREEIKSYPLDARKLPVELEHHFGGKIDTFSMICYPRDP